MQVLSNDIDSKVSLVLDNVFSCDWNGEPVTVTPHNGMFEGGRPMFCIVSMAAFRRGLCSHEATAFVATEKDARSEAERRCLVEFPPSEGYAHHNVCVEYLQPTLLRLYAAQVAFNYNGKAPARE